MASPPKPWERPGAAAAAAGTATLSSASAPSASSSAFSPSPPSSTSVATAADAPPLPELPSSLSSSVNQNAAAYSRIGGAASPYGSYGGAYSSPYSSPYSRFGGMGGMGGMAGMSGLGSYGGGMYGGYGGGMYGGMYGGMGGMQRNPNDPNSLTNRFSNGTAATFQMLEGIVTAFGGFAQMLESTYMATHSSFFAMVSVAEQFGNLRDTLGSILGIFTLMRWIRTLIAKLTGRPPPADATALTPAAFARFEGRTSGPDGAPARASRKPLFFFLAAAFGLPYLMSKMIRTLAASQDEEERRMQQAQAQQAIDPSRLEFCRLLYDFTPQAPASGLELQVHKGDLVAVLAKTDPAGNPSEWWQCRSRDGRQGYLPSTYLEVLRRPTAEPAKAIQAKPASVTEDDASSTTTATTTTPGAANAPIEPAQEGKKEYTTAGGMQRSHFYS